MGENTHACCCDHSEEALLKRIGELAAEYRGKRKSDTGPSYGAGNIWLSASGGPEGHSGRSGHQSGRGIGGSDVLFIFSTQPRGEHTIRVCLGTACYVRGGKKIVERLKELLDVEIGETTADRRFTFEVARCIGACGLAPAMSIDDQVYKQVNPDKLEQILERYYEEEGQE